MKRFTVAMLFVCAGCRFSVGGLNDIGAGGEPDLAVGDMDPMDPGDLANGVADMATPAGGDMVADPCAGAPALGNGNIAAQCVIGTPPTIDGNLADWPQASFLPLTKTTAAQANGTWDVVGNPNDANSSARYFVRWDLTYLYVAVSITDDVPNTPNTTPSQLSNNDAIEIFVDGQHERDSQYDTNDWQLVYSADFTATNMKKVAAQGSVVTWPNGTLEVIGGTSPSFTLEAAIPWTIFGSNAAALGRLIGFDLKLDDNDVGTARDRDLILFYGPANGNGSCTAPNCRTDVWGTVQLQGR